MVLWYTASASRSDTVLGRVEESRRTNIDVGIKLVYVRHDHSDAAGTRTTANASRLWRTVNAEISIPVAQKEIESSRPKRILRSGLHTVGGHRQVARHLKSRLRGRMTKPKQSGAFSGHRFPPEIIGYAVWAYHRFPMSLRDVEDLLAARGIVVSYETIRAWLAKFGSHYAKQIRRDRPRVADKWHLDEVVLPINGKKYWLWRAVDSKGDVLDILVQSRRNKRAASRFFRKLFKAFGAPRVIVTDKLRSYGAALKELAPRIEHRSHKGLNNRSEGSHRPTRRREKIMGRFKSPRQAQRFLTVHDQVQTIFRPRRHTLSAAAYRQTRADAHWIWDDITRELKAV